MNTTAPLAPPDKQADPQSSEDTRGIFLEKVGISRVKYPVLISGWQDGISREVEGTFDLTVSLAAENRGIHMSRLIETLHAWREPLSPDSLQSFLAEMRQRQGAEEAAVQCRFTWFINRPAPKTHQPAWLGIDTVWSAEQNSGGGNNGYTLDIPVTTLCPCSREISDYGAHSQRSWITVKLEWNASDAIIPPGEVFETLQHAGSAAIYPLLKRPDERHVTMAAYDQPAFVEDTARNAADLLRKDPLVSSFRIEVRNEESIHTHDAVAVVSSARISEGDDHPPKQA